MKMISCVSENGRIGDGKDMCFHISEDLKYFRSKTENNIVVMGSNTLRSLPNGRPLKNRENFVLSTSIDSETADMLGYKVFPSVESLIGYLNRLSSKGDSREVYVIGGSRVYEEMLPYCNEVLLTRVFAKGYGDTMFPDIRRHRDFRTNKDYYLIGESEDRWILEEGKEIKKDTNGLSFRFDTYRREQPFLEICF